MFHILHIKCEKFSFKIVAERHVFSIISKIKAFSIFTISTNRLRYIITRLSKLTQRAPCSSKINANVFASFAF